MEKPKLQGPELRKEPRYSWNLLPKKWQQLSLLLPGGQEIPIQTTDASLSGFGFIAKADNQVFNKDTRIILNGPDNKNIYGKIVYCKQLSRSVVQAGVVLTNTRASEFYREMIESILH